MCGARSTLGRQDATAGDIVALILNVRLAGVSEPRSGLREDFRAAVLRPFASARASRNRPRTRKTCAGPTYTQWTS